MLHKVLRIAPVNAADELFLRKSSAAVLHRQRNADVGAVLRNALHVDEGSHKKRARFVRAFAAFKAGSVAGADKLRHFADHGAERLDFRRTAAVLLCGAAGRGNAKRHNRAAQVIKLFPAAGGKPLALCQNVAGGFADAQGVLRNVVAVVAAGQKPCDCLCLLLGKLALRNLQQIGVQRFVHAHNGGVLLVYAVDGDGLIAAKAHQRTRHTFGGEAGDFCVDDSRRLKGKAWGDEQMLVQSGNVAVHFGTVGGHGEGAELLQKLGKRNEHKGHYHVEQGVEVCNAAFINGFVPKGEHSGVLKHNHSGGEKHCSDYIEIQVRKCRALRRL